MITDLYTEKSYIIYDIRFIYIRGDIYDNWFVYIRSDIIYDSWFVYISDNSWVVYIRSDISFMITDLHT